jgi:hypothetical protein
MTARVVVSGRSWQREAVTWPRVVSSSMGGTRHCANQLTLSTAPLDVG